MKLNAEEVFVPFKGIGADGSDTRMHNCERDERGGSPSCVDEDASLLWLW